MLKISSGYPETTTSDDNSADYWGHLLGASIKDHAPRHTVWPLRISLLNYLPYLSIILQCLMPRAVCAGRLADIQELVRTLRAPA